MKTKIVKKFMYDGLGFPIELLNVQLVNINGDWVPKIDVRQVANEAIKKLSTQESRLTGNQVKFIRSYFSMPLREFGKKVVHETHAAVKKWESKGDEITSMNENTEQVLRLFIIEQTSTPKSDFYKVFQQSKRFFGKNDKPEILHIAA
jgi:DNA-binding transcriptional regulator YiaG